jgi:hypothetical protein
MMLTYYRQRRSHPIGTFSFVAGKRGKLPEEARDAPQVFLVDRKKGARIKRAAHSLEAHGYASQARSFRNLQLLELWRSH